MEGSRREIIKALSNERYRLSKENIPTGDPGNWFLEHQQFIQWRDDADGSLLWVSGNPGCGKSVLAKALIDRGLLRSDSSNATVCYFFFVASSVEDSQATTALKAILQQLFVAKPAVSDLLARYETNRPIYLAELWNLFRNATEDPQAGDIVVVLDALDECEELGRDELIKFLTNFYDHTSRRTLKFLVTSRPSTEMERMLKRLRRSQVMSKIEFGEKGIQQDLDRFIDEKVAEIAIRLKLNYEHKVSLKLVLHSIPNPTFLQLRLVFEAILKSKRYLTGARLDEIIKESSRPIFEQYEQILRSSRDLPLARRLLQILVVSNRRLSLRELYLALYIEDGITSYADPKLKYDSLFPEIIEELCGALVVITDSGVEISHFSVKDFLILKGGFSSNNEMRSSRWGYLNVHSVDLKEAHLILAKSCMTYLFLDCFDKDPLVVDDEELLLTRVHAYTEKNALLDYAASYWPYHFQQAKGEVETGLLTQAIELCSTKRGRFQSWFQVYWLAIDSKTLFPKKLTDLIVASHVGLTAIVSFILNAKDDKARANLIKHRDSHGCTALHMSAANGQEDVVSLLLKYKASTAARDDFENKPLHLAAGHGHPAVVQLLLAEDTDFKSTNKNDQSPKELAIAGRDEAKSDSARERYTSVVQLLKVKEFAELGLAESALPEWTSVDTEFKATITHFLKDSPKKQPRSFYVSDLIKKEGIMDAGVPPELLTCRWVHLPANNVRYLHY